MTFEDYVFAAYDTSAFLLFEPMLQADYRVLIPDPHGSGNSDRAIDSLLRNDERNEHERQHGAKQI